MATVLESNSAVLDEELTSVDVRQDDIIVRVDSSDVIDIGDIQDDSISNRTVHWPLLGKSFPKSEIVYFSQIIILFVIIIVSLVNLTTGASDTNLWASTLSGSIGYLLPNPTLNRTSK